jgi:cell division septation protein DedD
MHPLLTSLNSAQRARNGLLALACVALLSGCSIWPKSWTRSSEAEPAQASAPAEPDTKTPVAPPQFVENTPPAARQEVVVNPVAEPVRTEPAPVVALAPASPPPASAAPAMAPAPSAKAAKGTKGAKAVKTAPAGGLEHAFYINVGLFAVPSNASNASQKLADAQLPVFTQDLQTKKGKLTRVRVGPFSNRGLAEAAATKIHALQLDAIVFQH